MSKEFILPDIGEGIVECEIVEWLVTVGETVKEDQPICDVMTDKALVQIPAVHNGVISKLHYEKGEIAKVHAPLFTMDTDIDQTEVNNDNSVTEHNDSTNFEDFILPDIGEGIVECEIVEWLVSEGDKISEDQPVCDVMTDKALVQIPAKYDGTVAKLYYGKGDIAQVHSPLFQMQLKNGTTKSVDSLPEQLNELINSSVNTKSKEKRLPSNGKAIASPAVRRLAKENDLDISKIPGSGKNGRVYKADITDFLNSGSQVIETVDTVNNSVAEKPPVIESSATRVEPLKGMKAMMAKQMVASVSSIPHFTFSDEVDLTNLISLRKELKESYAKQGIKLTMMPFFIKALSLAIKEFPILNSKVDEHCTEITYFENHNIGMAVDSKLGLLVPNIKHCQDRSIVDIANEVTRLTELAREGRVSPEDLKGGTISISNIGAIGGTTATPIINKPEVAIVALGKLQNLPRFDENNQVISRSIMQVSWSGDHRVIDGATIARFNNLWKSYLEEPAKMLMVMS